MHSPVFLFDTYELARGALHPDALELALSTAVRLGRNALPEERQAAFALPLAQQNLPAARACLADEVVEEIVQLCLPRAQETPEQRARRVLESSNLSAVRLLLAEWYHQEYGCGDAPGAASRARRAAIRILCRALPAEVHSDILQGELTPTDADFLSVPDFPTMTASLH